MKVGIVANEFFDPAVGRVGGFGWVARQASLLLRSRNEGRIETVFLTGEITGRGETTLACGTRLIYCRKKSPGYWWQLIRERIDVLLAVDYRPGYRDVLSLLSSTPIVFWVQEPRPAADVAKVATLRIPGQDEAPAGSRSINCTSFAEVAKASQKRGRPIEYVAPAPSFLHAKASAAYGVTIPPPGFLGYGIPCDPQWDIVPKHPRPRVLFLGRLDPIKRPWLFLELARHFPEVEFVFAGKNHFDGTSGGWHPENTPPNVRFTGHVDGPAKFELIRSSWVLINTSIHEALPVSFLEALDGEVPILSCQNPEDVTSRFGRFVGHWDGDGMDGLPRLREFLRELLEDHNLRAALGTAGRTWVRQNHSIPAFAKSFRDACRRVGIQHDFGIDAE